MLRNKKMKHKWKKNNVLLFFLFLMKKRMDVFKSTWIWSVWIHWNVSFGWIWITFPCNLMAIYFTSSLSLNHSYYIYILCFWNSWSDTPIRCSVRPQKTWDFTLFWKLPFCSFLSNSLWIFKFHTFEQSISIGKFW